MHIPAFAIPPERLKRDEPLARRGTLRIGGQAAWWVDVHTLDELGRVLGECARLGLTTHVVGLGSNSLYDDGRTEAVFIRLGGELAGWSEVGPGQGAQTARWRIGAGSVNAHVVRAMLEAGWVGAEFLVLIPGTLGGAVAMNAGTREQDLKSILVEADLMVPDTHEPHVFHCATLSASELAMRYRHAEVPPGAVIVSATVELWRSDVEEARERVQQDRDRRNQTQPYRLASVGSTFANPAGDFAGRLIEATGLKGHHVGGARVSPLHANFFINEDKATSRDFLSLMALARTRVRQSFGVELTPEVRFVGFDGWSRLQEYEHQWHTRQI